MRSIARKVSPRKQQDEAAEIADEPTEVERLRERNTKLAGEFGQVNALFDTWDRLTKAGQYEAARLVDRQLEAARSQVLTTLGSGVAA
jgi:hypothetical protein